MNFCSHSRYVVITLLTCSALILVAAEPAAEPHPDWVKLQFRLRPRTDAGQFRMNCDRGNCNISYFIRDIKQIPMLLLSSQSYDFHSNRKLIAEFGARKAFNKSMLQGKTGVHFPLGYHIYKVVSVGDDRAECVISEHDPLGKPQAEYTVLYWPYEFDIYYRTNEEGSRTENIEWKGEAGDEKNPVIKGESIKYLTRDEKVTRDVEFKVGSLVGENFIITKIVRPDAEKKIVGWLELQFIGAKDQERK